MSGVEARGGVGAQYLGHVLFAVLLAVGTVRAVRQVDPAWLPVTGATATAVWYLAGALAVPRAANRPAAARGWLLGLLAAWVALVAISGEFVWLAFLWAMLAPHLFRTRIAAPLLAAVTAVSVVGFGWHRGEWQAGAILGPIIGIVATAAVTGAYERLRAQSEERQRLLAELLAAQRALAAHEREAGRVAEREHLARELHDTVGQSLASVILLLRAAIGPTTAHAPQHCVTQLNTALDTALAALEDTRRFVRGLEPAALEGSGLEDALAAQAAESGGFGLPTAFTVAGVPRRLPTAVEVALLRATQEALANVRQHAAATRAAVTLTFQDDEVSVDIVDDGRGFRPDATVERRSDGSGFGLAGMRSRIRECGGDVSIESEPGGGAAVRVTAPLAVPEPRAAASCPVAHG